MIKRNISAFPLQNSHSDYRGSNMHHANGMELRDWFAGQHLTGLISDNGSCLTDEDIADRCYKVADAMMARREIRE